MASGRRISAKVVSISRGRTAVRHVSPRRHFPPLGMRDVAKARAPQLETRGRITPAWVCIASLISVTMWPSAVVLLAKLALGILWR